jgi:hypothetical protein
VHRDVNKHIAVFLVGLILGLCGCSDDEPSGHEKMLAILEQIKDRAPEEHEYFGRGIHKEKRKQLEKLGPNASKLERFEALRELGYQELLYEETPRQAIEHLTEALQLFSRADAGMTDAVNETTFWLAVACLRLGETENCCASYSSQSCILPIRGSGIHTKKQGSRQAIKYFIDILENSSQRPGPDSKDNGALWLLNIAYMTLGEYPDHVPEKYRIPPKFFQSEVEFPEFENVAPKLGLNTYNHAGGAIVDDFDNDDYLDILTSSSDPTLQTRFFHNNRDGTFTERTKEAGLVGMYGGLNMVQADYNNDGNLDVYILRGAWLEEFGQHPNSLLRNNGNGTFTDVTFEAGLGHVHYPSKTAAWADYDNDGDLDLFVANEDSPSIAAPCQLFRNNGDGKFTDVAKQAGVQSRKFSMGTVWGDYDNDRFPDLFLAGGRPPISLFHNNGNGTFTDVAKPLGLTGPVNMFPVWFWDFDNDGVLDIYVSTSTLGIGLLAFDAINDAAKSEPESLHETSRRKPAAARYRRFELPALYRGDGQGGFVDVAHEQNLSYPTAPMGANFGDLNGDGFLDFYLATGDIFYWDLRPNVMFLNKGGDGFANVTMGGGFGHLQKGHGVSFADIDNDGDQDVYVQMGGQLPGDKFYDALFENPGFGHHSITVKLIGKTSNYSAIGARIHVRIVEDGKQRSIYRHVNSGGSFGCNPLRQNIGLGKADRIDSIEIYWPTSDLTQTFRDVAMDQTVELVEGDKEFKTVQLKTLVLGGK